MTELVPLSDQVDCVRREIAQRRRVYPRLIERGKMTQVAADREIARMEAVLASIEKLRQGEKLL